MLVQTFLAHAPHVVAGIDFGLVQNAEVDAGALQQPRKGLGYLLIAGVERRVVADEPQQVDRLLARIFYGKGQTLGPRAALAFRLAKRVTELVDGLQGLLQQRIHLAALDELASHLNDDRHMLARDRTYCDTRHAGSTGPQRLGGHLAGLAAVNIQVRIPWNEIALQGSVRMFPERQDQVSRRQRRASCTRRTGFMALAALGAG